MSEITIYKVHCNYCINAAFADPASRLSEVRYFPDLDGAVVMADNMRSMYHDAQIRTERLVTRIDGPRDLCNALNGIGWVLHAEDVPASTEAN